MVKQLIASFLNQRYPCKELIISDDSTGDAIERLVQSFPDHPIRYYKNLETLGYSTNLLHTLQLATSDFIIILGDDDLFIRPDVLDRYVDAFNQDEDTLYIYSNIVQFTNSLKAEYEYRSFPTSERFLSGDKAMAAMWTSSIFIAGIGLRNGEHLSDLYPVEDMLFPQVELVGHLLNRGNAYAIGDFLIGGRAHADQLGFHALKGERIKGGEEHATAELFAILNRLKEQYQLNYDEDALAQELIGRYYLMMLKEKSIAGSKAVHDYYLSFRSLSTVARRSKTFAVAHALALVLPANLIRITRGVFLKVIRLVKYKAIAEHERQIREMVQL